MSYWKNTRCRIFFYLPFNFKTFFLTRISCIRLLQTCLPYISFTFSPDFHTYELLETRWPVAYTAQNNQSRQTTPILNPQINISPILFMSFRVSFSTLVCGDTRLVKIEGHCYFYVRVRNTTYVVRTLSKLR